MYLLKFRSIGSIKSVVPRNMCHGEEGMASPLCTGDTGVPVVKAHWALVRPFNCCGIAVMGR